MMSARWLVLFRSRSDDERGSAAIEAAIGVPAFLLFVGLIIFAGRTALAHQAVEQAAYDAARAASISRTTTAADQAAEAAASQSLTNQGLHCGGTNVVVEAADVDGAVGSYGSVSVRVECVVDLSDLSVPGVPGTRLVAAEMSSVVDPHRERG